MESFDDRARFIRAQTVLTEVPFVPEIRLHTATDLAPIWRATQARLSDLGVDVPFWCVPWAGGQALARWVLDHPEAVSGLRVVDFGTGSGLVAIACARAGARSVRGIDTDPLAAVACALNAEANEVAVDALCLDVVGHDARTLDADIVLASTSGTSALRRKPLVRGSPISHAPACASSREIRRARMYRPISSSSLATTC